MNKIVAVVGALAFTAVVMVAWIKGGTQPMRWIEQPVSVGVAPQ